MRANGLDYILGLAPTTHAPPACHRPGEKHRGALRGRAERRQGPPLQGILRRRQELEPGPPHRRPRRGRRDGTDTRFIVTNLGHGSGRSLYQDLYCRRGQAENHIKAWKTHLAADRTSCPKATANQFRLFLHAGAYWLLWSLRR